MGRWSGSIENQAKLWFTENWGESRKVVGELIAGSENWKIKKISKLASSQSTKVII